MGVLASEGITIGERNRQLETQYNSLRQLKPRVTDNFESLNKELSETESAILSFEEIVRQLIYKLSVIDEAIHRLTSDIQLVCDDIRNNEDAARLQKFGSESSDGQISTSICPTCKQQIQDNLLEATPCSGFMNIEENIRHLKAQKSMLEFSLNSRKNYRDALQREKTNYESRLLTLRRLAQTIRSDLFTSTDTDASETIILKKIEISKQIERFGKFARRFYLFSGCSYSLVGSLE